MFDVWVVSIRKLASKEEMGENFVLSPEEQLGDERIIIKLEELWGGLLRGGDNCCKEVDWIGLLEEKNAFHLWFVVLHLPLDLNATMMFCTNILQDIKLYIVGSLSKTFSLINDGVSKGVNKHYWEGRVLMIRISKLLRGPKKVHYLVRSNKIDTLKPGLSAYSWKGVSHTNMAMAGSLNV
jgi:hypothetical protein